MAEINSQFTIVNLLEWLIFKIHTYIMATTDGKTIPVFNAKAEYWHRWLWDFKTSGSSEYNNADFIDEITRLVGMSFDWSSHYPKHPDLDESWSLFLHNYFNSSWHGGFIMLTKPTSPLPRIWEIIIAREMAKIILDGSPLFRRQNLDWK